MQKFSDVAVLIDSALLRTSGQCKKLNLVDRTHPTLVRAVLQKSGNNNNCSHASYEIDTELSVVIGKQANQSLVLGYKVA